jgi:hypothetical protein
VRGASCSTRRANWTAIVVTPSVFLATVERSGNDRSPENLSPTPASAPMSHIRTSKQSGAAIKSPFSRGPRHSEVHLSSSPVPLGRGRLPGAATLARAESRTHATRLVLSRSLRDAHQKPPGYGEGTRVRAVRVHPRRRKPGPAEVGTA